MFWMTFISVCDLEPADAFVGLVQSPDYCIRS